MKRYALIIGIMLFCFAVKAQSVTYTCRYWFDQNHTQAVTTTFSDSIWQTEIDVGSLTDGLHTLYIHVMDTSMKWSAPKSYLFFKVDETLPENYLYHCWFDQDFDNQQSGVIGDGSFILDVADIEEGLHTVNVIVEGHALTSTKCYLFFKMPVEDPNIEQQYLCWFDDDYSTLQTGLLGDGSFLLDVDALSSGLHTVNIQLKKGTRTSPKSYFFFKTDGIVKWEYCINGDWDNKITTEVEITDTLDVIGLLPVETQPIRSTCFQFHPNGDTPEIFAKNEITFRFWDSGKRIKDQSKFYVDENVVEVIQADTLERNSTETMPAPRNNQITWFKLDAGIGDSLSFVANKACTMQLFAPSGEEVYSATASEAIVFGGCHAWEDGTYYLAVHDVMGSGETVSVTYNWIYKCAILAYDVHLVGNGGRSTITFQGNGFDSLLDVYLVNYLNDTIHYLDIGHESNTTTTVTFDFYQVNLGVYDAVFQFYDETMRVNNALEVEEATPFEFEANVSFAARYLRTMSNKYVFQVHNYSNMTAYNVPLLVHVYTSDAESLTRVDVEGFNVKSDLIRLFGSHYSDSLDNVIEQKRLTSGDLFGFLEDPNTEYVPDAPYLHYIFITPNLRPNTTETITIAVQSTNTVYVYLWYPEEWENEDPTDKLSRTRSANDKSRGYVSRHDWMCAQNELLANANEPPRYPNIICDGDHDPDGGGIGGPSIPVNSLDPNDIHGYLSESGSHYMRQEIQNVQYEIEFENDTTLATAAAHTIIVRDTLDASKFDLNSLAARSVTIGDKRLDLNGEQTFARTLDLRPEIYVIAQINQDYDPTTGIIQWTIQSLDPMTMEPTDDPNQGVLPVNYFGNGVGFIDYSINLKEAFADGTEISNRAGIIFDQEDIIMTPTWTNTVDAVKPTSHIEEVTPVADSLSFSFVSEDNRSGVWYHSLYYRNDSTQMQWQVKKPQITENSLMLYFDDFQTTEYLVMATDSAGNHEEKEMVAEYIYYYDGPATVMQANTLAQGWNWWSTYVEMNGTDGLTMLENSLGTNGLNIKSGNGYSVEYIPDWEMWWGDEIEIRNESMYEINVETTGAVSVAGTLTNPASHPITIAPGWNWIGYPVNGSLPTETALSSLSPMEDDIIQDRGEYSMYWPDYGFWGDVEYLVPGKGYKYLSHSTEAQTLTYPSSRGKALANKPQSAETRPEARQHQYLMNVVAVAELDGEEINAEHFELLALSEGQVRGRAMLRHCEPNGRYVALLLVYGDASETLEFRLRDTESGKVYEGTERMDFKAEKVVGGLRKPFTVHFGCGHTDAFVMEGMFPNPAKAGETVSLNLMDATIEAGVSDIEIFNALGERVSANYTKTTPLSFKAPQNAGVYVVRLTSNGVTYHGTLIVTQ